MVIKRIKYKLLQVCFFCIESSLRLEIKVYKFRDKMCLKMDVEISYVRRVVKTEKEEFERC